MLPGPLWHRCPQLYLRQVEYGPVCGVSSWAKCSEQLQPSNCIFRLRFLRRNADRRRVPFRRARKDHRLRQRNLLERDSHRDQELHSGRSRLHSWSDYSPKKAQSRRRMRLPAGFASEFWPQSDSHLALQFRRRLGRDAWQLRSQLLRFQGCCVQDCFSKVITSLTHLTCQIN